MAFTTFSAAPPIGHARVGYDTWVKLYDPQTPEALEAIARDVAGLAAKPRFSIIVPVYNTEERWLRKCVDSVRRQVYGDWELCIANDASPDPRVRQVLDAAGQKGMQERQYEQYRCNKLD